MDNDIRSDYIIEASYHLIQAMKSLEVVIYHRDGDKSISDIFEKMLSVQADLKAVLRAENYGLWKVSDSGQV